jgi:hypothetical protein
MKTMKGFNIELVQKRFIKKTNEEREQLSITRKNKKLITLKDVQTIYEHYLSKGIPSKRIAIVGENAERLFTIKGLKSEEIFNGNNDDYMDGKSEEVIDKLSKFKSLQVVVY